MKLLLKHSNFCTDEHFQFLKSRFESVGFDVLDKNVCCLDSEIETQDLKAVDYVIDFSHLYSSNRYYVHDLLLIDLFSLSKMGVAVVRFDSIICFNKDMGIIEKTGNLVFPSFFFKSSLLINEDIANVLNNPLPYLKQGIAIELNDIEFIKQKGTFYKETFTDEMLKNGNWTIQGYNSNIDGRPGNQRANGRTGNNMDRRARDLGKKGNGKG